MNVEIKKDVTLKDLTTAFGGTIPDQHPTEYIQARLASNYVFLAWHEGKPIAFAIYTIIWGNCPFLELIKVQEEYRGQTIGTQLLEAVKNEIQSKGFKKLLSSTEVTNPRSHEWHLKRGFKELNTLMLSHGEEQFFRIEL